MKIRPKIWVAAVFIASLSLCAFQISTRLSTAQNSFNPAAPSRWSEMTSEQKDAYNERNRLFREAWHQALQGNYQAKYNNDSKRKGMSAEELPVEMRGKALEIANQYKNHIYPALIKYANEHEGQIPNAAASIDLPGLPASYTEDAKFKGTGPYMYSRGSWSIGISWRLDGTIASRNLYSKNSDDEPHDVWAQNTKFDDPTASVKIRVRGWDDGKVTFDNIEDDFYATILRPAAIGEIPGQASPGQAGIPPKAILGLKKWQKNPNQ